MKRSKPIKHRSVVNLLDAIRTRTPISKSGTYNPADPTQWSKGSYVSPDGTYLLEVDDNTWGAEITLSKIVSKRKTIIIAEVGIYDNEVYIRYRRRGIRKLWNHFYKASEGLPTLDEIWNKYSQYEEDPMGCPSMYI